MALQRFVGKVIQVRDGLVRVHSGEMKPNSISELVLSFDEKSPLNTLNQAGMLLNTELAVERFNGDHKVTVTSGPLKGQNYKVALGYDQPTTGSYGGMH